MQESNDVKACPASGHQLCNTADFNHNQRCMLSSMENDGSRGRIRGRVGESSFTGRAQDASQKKTKGTSVQYQCMQQANALNGMLSRRRTEYSRRNSFFRPCSLDDIRFAWHRWWTAEPCFVRKAGHRNATDAEWSVPGADFSKRNEHAIWRGARKRLARCQDRPFDRVYSVFDDDIYPSEVKSYKRRGVAWVVLPAKGLFGGCIETNHVDRTASAQHHLGM